MIGVTAEAIMMNGEETMSGATEAEAEEVNKIIS